MRIIFVLSLGAFFLTPDTCLNRLDTFPRSTSSTQHVSPIPPLGSTPSAHSTSLVKNTPLASSSTRLFTSQIECHYCHARGHIASHCPQRTLVIEFKDDSFFEDTDELLVMDLLEPDYEDDPFVMYEDDCPLMRITFM